MSGNKILLDTNIIIYILLGNQNYISKVIDKDIYISFISKLEILGYKFDNIKDEQKALEFLNETYKLNINEKIENLVILIKRKYNIKLPDCIILATSLFYNIELLTNDENLLKIYNRSLGDDEIMQQAEMAGF